MVSRPSSAAPDKPRKQRARSEFPTEQKPHAEPKQKTRKKERSTSTALSAAASTKASARKSKVASSKVAIEDSTTPGDAHTLGGQTIAGPRAKKSAFLPPIVDTSRAHHEFSAIQEHAVDDHDTSPTSQLSRGKRGAKSPIKAIVVVSPQPKTNPRVGIDEDGDDAAAEASLSLEEDTDATAHGVLYDVLVQTRRCEKQCYDLGLKLADVRKMKRKYNANDMYMTGEITQAEFFFILNEDRRPLTMGIFQFAGVTRDQKFISFDEYLLCVTGLASLTPPELYQFVFDVYDADKSGTLDEHEFAKMSLELQSKQFSFPKNVATAIAMMEGKEPTTGVRDKRRSYISEDGLVDLGQFMRFAKLFSVAFFPIFNFQKNVRRATLGEGKWSKLVARRMQIQEMVTHMRRNFGAIPALTWSQRLWSCVNPDPMEIRKRAAELYGKDLARRRRAGEDG